MAEEVKAGKLETGEAVVAEVVVAEPHSSCCSHPLTETAPCEPSLGMSVRLHLEEERHTHRNTGQAL